MRHRSPTRDPLHLVALFALLAFVAGCGGSVTRPGGDAATSGVDGGGGSCPARVTAGGACAQGSPVCLAADGCNDCYCTGGFWVCEGRTCAADAGPCPAARPRTGDACAESRLTCGYGTGCTGAQCVCAGGRWSCDAILCRDQ